jgi:hypothetical protein
MLLNHMAGFFAIYSFLVLTTAAGLEPLTKGWWDPCFTSDAAAGKDPLAIADLAMVLSQKKSL